MRTPTIAALALALCACNPGQPTATGPAPAAQAPAAATASATLGDAVLRTSTIPLADLGDAVAARYGIDTRGEGVLLLVTVRDAAGDAIAAGDLRLDATATVLPQGAAPLALRRIEAAGMTDYIGVVETRAPATIQFRINAIRGGSRADIATTVELPPQ